MPKSIPEVSLAKISPSQESEGDSPDLEALSLSDFSKSWNESVRNGCSWRTSRGFSLRIAVATSPDSSTRWGNSGSAFRGEFWTRNISESLNDGGECFLSEVMDLSAPKKYFMSANAARGILQRATRRGRALPEDLAAALQAIADGLDSGETVRRLTPTETERLMSWPDGWTIAKDWNPRRKKTEA